MPEGEATQDYADGGTPASLALKIRAIRRCGVAEHPSNTPYKLSEGGDAAGISPFASWLVHMFHERSSSRQLARTSEHRTSSSPPPVTDLRITFTPKSGKYGGSILSL
jgi:hypothetical protein